MNIFRNIALRVLGCDCGRCVRQLRLRIVGVVSVVALAGWFSVAFAQFADDVARIAAP